MSNQQLLYLFLLTCLSLPGTHAYVQKTCGPGQRLAVNYRRRRSGAKRCLDCGTGRYQPSQKHTVGECWVCPSGKYSGSLKASQCLGGAVCAPGRYGKIGATSPSQVTACQDCELGRYQPVFGQGECLMCPGGQGSNTTGSRECTGTPCQPGYYGASLATLPGQCQACPPETFTDFHGALSCQACPSGQYTLKTGSSSCQDQPNCGPYHYLLEDYTCAECHPYIRYVGASACALLILAILISCCGRRSCLFAGQIVAMLVIAIVTAKCGKTSDASLYSMMGVCVYCLCQTFYLVCKTSPTES